MDEPRWLDDQQQAAWRRLAAVVLKLPSELDQQLQRDADMTHFEYWVLALLSEEPDHRLRLSHLADRANSSLSRLSHVITRLEKRGWVVRERCADDARATFAVLTPAGLTKVVEAAPGHVDTVRRFVFGGLDDQGVQDLTHVCEAIVEQLDGRRPKVRTVER